MPVYTEIIRNGKKVPIKGGWSWWHLNRLAEAMEEENEGRDLGLFPKTGVYTFKEDHGFSAPEEEVWQRGGTLGVIYNFDIYAGDEYHAFR